MSVPGKYRIFSLPEQNIISNGNAKDLIRITPKNGSVYYSNRGDTIDFNIASHHQLIDPKSIAIKAKLQPETYTAGSIEISGLGAAACFSKVEVDMKGHKFEEPDRYNLLAASKYHFESDEKRTMLKKFEGYEGTVGSTLATAGSVFIHHPVLGFLDHNKELPLPYVTGGMNIRFQLADSAQVVLDTSGNFKLSDVELIAKSTAVTPEYHQQVIADIESGRAINIPYRKFKQYVQYGNGSQELVVSIPVNHVSSVREIWCRMRNTTTLSTQTYDKFMGKFTSSSLESYYLTVEGKNYPQGRPIQYLNRADTNLYDPEHAFLAYVDDQKEPVTFEDADFFLKIKLTDDDFFGSGLSAENEGVIKLNLRAKSGQTFAATTAIDVFTVNDAIARITKDSISTIEKF